VTRAQTLKPMTTVVQCRWPRNPFFETIAAFNDKGVADAYAADCARANPQLTYQTVELKRRYARAR
jgi:hypothetical protein